MSPGDSGTGRVVAHGQARAPQATEKGEHRIYTLDNRRPATDYEVGAVLGLGTRGAGVEA